MIRSILSKIFNKSNSAVKEKESKPLSITPILKTPDYPCPFGYKIAWFAVKCNSPEEAIRNLSLKLISDCNWAFGIKAAYKDEKIFVSPCLDGFVLVIGIDAELDRKALVDASKHFEEIQYFSSHRIVEYHKWVKIMNGEIIRAYSYIGERGEVVMDEGDMSSEEIQLGFASYINSTNQEGDWDSLEFPDEESVLKIAAAWGVDPKFKEKEYSELTGYLCIV